MKGQGISLKRIFRRFTALFLATVTCWFVSLTCNPDAFFRRLASSPAFLAAALEFELGPITQEQSVWNQLTPLHRLALSQSPALRNSVPSVSPESSPSPVSPPVNGTADDQQEQLPQSAADQNAVEERTLTTGSGENFLSASDISLYNYTSQAVDLQALLSSAPNLDLTGPGPKILIIHTHTTEAYAMTPSALYEESDPARTLDEQHNMLRIGEEIRQTFEDMGLQAVHDRTLYDYPQYSGAYTRSCEGIKTWLEEYPTIQVVLDIHRDALVDEDGTVYKPVTELDGQKMAQAMLVVGTDDQGQDHPYWQENLTLAIRIQQAMGRQCDEMARPIALRSSRFNQQLTRGSLLVEIGSHGNTLDEALLCARTFARAAGEILLSFT